MDFLEPNFSVYDILRYSEGINFILGATKSGKTTFLKRFILSQPQQKDIYLLDTSGKNVKNDLSSFNAVITLPYEFQFNEDCLENLNPDSILIIDDFVLNSKLEAFQRVCNYSAHHLKLSIFLVVHSHLHTRGLFYYITNNCNIYLTYSNNSKNFLRAIGNGRYLSFFNSNWKKGISEFHVCFINTNYSVIINFIDCLLSNDLFKQAGVIMADLSDHDILNSIPVTEKKWYISDKPIINDDNESSREGEGANENKREEFYSNELAKLYPSKRTFPRIFKIVRCLLSRNVIFDNEMVLGKVNIFDFLSFTQKMNNKKMNKKEDFPLSPNSSENEMRLFDEKSSLGFLYINEQRDKKEKKRKKKERNFFSQDADGRMIRLCKRLKRRGVIIPISLLKNSKAREIFR